MLRALAAIVLVLSPSPLLAQGDQPPPSPPPPASQPAPAPATQPPAPKRGPTAVDREEPRPFRLRAASEAAMPDGSPVVRATGGQLGMFFRFGGLATLFASGSSRAVPGSSSGSSSSTATEPLLLTQVGLKFVSSERLMIPIYVGSSVRVVSPESGANRTDWGLDFGAGLEFHFRIWRRISPFAGLMLGLGFSDPSGENNRIIGFGIGPILGVEYYIADRVSLSAQYQLTLQVVGEDRPSGSSGSSSTTTFMFQSQAGGAMTLSYYF
jgi:hypothetical protein